MSRDRSHGRNDTARLDTVRGGSGAIIPGVTVGEKFGKQAVNDSVPLDLKPNHRALT